jgi:hypothetical protein
LVHCDFGELIDKQVELIGMYLGTCNRALKLFADLEFGGFRFICECPSVERNEAKKQERESKGKQNALAEHKNLRRYSVCRGLIVVDASDPLRNA